MRFVKSLRIMMTAALIAAGFALVTATPATAATFNVDSTADDGSGGTTLREAIVAANADATADTITFGVSGTITLTSAISITEDLTITGPGASILTINGGGVGRIFTSTASSLTVSGLTLTNGVVGAGLSGGAIYAAGGSVTVRSSVITGNTANGGLPNGGGGISVDSGALTIEDSTISNNTTNYEGGGIQHWAGDLRITRSTISGNNETNVASGAGGVLWRRTRNAVPATSAGDVIIESSTITGNTAAGTGGGLVTFFGSVAMNNSTISGNTAASGDGYAILGSTVTVSGSVVSANTDGDDFAIFAGTVTAATSLVGETPLGLTIGTGTSSNNDPMLGALADNGGPTFTMLPQPGSPLIDAGGTGAGAPAVDQRGFTRISNGAIDIGAVETPASAPVTTTTTPATTTTTVAATPTAIDPQPQPAVRLEIFRSTGLDEDADVHVIRINSDEVDLPGDSLMVDAYDIEADETDLDHADICVPYTDEDIEQLGISEDQLELFHFRSDTRDVITTRRMPDENLVCGRTGSFSPFAIGVLRTTRIAGRTAAGTAAALSSATFDSADVVYLAGASSPDALAAGPAAARVGAPLLLTATDRLEAATRRELRRLHADRIVIVGGAAAISLDVARALLGMGFEVTRVAGADRYATAAMLAPAGADTVYLVDARSPLDALVAGAIAARDDAAVLLTDGGRIPAATAAALDLLRPARTVDGTKVRMAIAAGDTEVLAVASVGDALAAVPAAIARGAALVIVGCDHVPTRIARALDQLGPTAITVVGGTSAISKQTESDLALHLSA